jgi:hypothetical protein
MRKTVLFTAAMVTAAMASAQTGEITSNRGENWLSQDGDWGLTFDAQPLLNYAGNLFNGTQENSGTALTWANSYYAIQGKKLIDANTAYRGKLRIGFGSNKNTDLVPDASSGAEAGDVVEDVTKNGHFDIVLGAGLEKRVGSTRVVGVYGAELFIAMHSAKTTYEYGNDLEDVGGSRDTEVKGPNTFGLGLGLFGGVEWFCAPKVSLSGEYTWGLSLNSVGHTETTTESLVDGDVESTTVESGTKQNNFGIDTGVSGLSIGVNFYFQ